LVADDETASCQSSKYRRELLSELIPTSQISRRLADFTGRDVPGYKRMYQLVIDGLIPAEQISGRWFIRAADLPKIAEKLELVPTIAA
jgi:hypothetical protein